MKLTPVIAALRARCPYFENRVAGAAQFKNLPEVGKLRLPAAYVVPGDDSPGENKSQTLLDLNRHELIYQFDFSVISELTEDDTRQQDDLNSLDELQTLAIDVDYLEPGNGPDGDIEHHTEITLPS
ncbi:phage tail terminator protein, partial [Escherichia coli]|uniref:phage tail terminator protein n=1 Tax=Escherichia coli TaxID=562 RepID=UPI002727B9F0